MSEPNSAEQRSLPSSTSTVHYNSIFTLKLYLYIIIHQLLFYMFLIFQCFLSSPGFVLFPFRTDWLAKPAVWLSQGDLPEFVFLGGRGGKGERSHFATCNMGLFNNHFYRTVNYCSRIIIVIIFVVTTITIFRVVQIMADRC